MGLPPDVDQLSDSDFQTPSAKRPRVSLPLVKPVAPDKHLAATEKAVASTKPAKKSQSSAPQPATSSMEELRYGEGRGYLKVGEGLVLGCFSSFRKNFNWVKCGGKEAAIVQAQEWLTKKRAEEPQGEGKSRAKGCKAAEEPTEAATKAEPKPKVVDPAAQAEMEELVRSFAGPHDAPQSGESYKQFTSRRLPDLRKHFPGHQMAVYFKIVGQEWKKGKPQQ